MQNQERKTMKQDNTHPTQEQIIEWNRAQNSKAEARHERRADLQGRTLAQYEATSRTIGWAWMAAIVMIIIQLLTCQTAPAQTMYEVQYKTQADVRLWKSKHRSQADFTYWIAPYRSQANRQFNHWYIVDYPSQAQVRFIWVTHRSEATHVVWQEKYASQTR